MLLKNIVEDIQYLHCAKLMTNTLRIFLLPIWCCLFLAGRTGSSNIPSAENLKKKMLICWQGCHTRQAEDFRHMVHISGQIASDVMTVQRRGKASPSCVRCETHTSHTSHSPCRWTGWFERCPAQRNSGDAGARWLLDSAATGDNEQSWFYVRPKEAEQSRADGAVPGSSQGPIQS